MTMDSRLIKAAKRTLLDNQLGPGFGQKYIFYSSVSMVLENENQTLFRGSSGRVEGSRDNA